LCGQIKDKVNFLRLWEEFIALQQVKPPWIIRAQLFTPIILRGTQTEMERVSVFTFDFPFV
jgi:hypothetical protein